MKRYAAFLFLLIGLLFAQAASAQDIVQIANEGATGTAANKIAKLTGAPSTAITTTVADTDGAVGIVVSGAGTTSNAYVAVLGTPSCVFDGPTTAGNYVIISTVVAGDCRDGGVTRPAAVQVLGRVLSTNGAGGTFQIKLEPNFSGTGGGGSVCGVNGQLLFNNGGVCGGLTVGAGLQSSGGSLLIPGGAVTNAMLVNSSITINTHNTALGASLVLAFSDFSGTIAASQCPNPAATTLGCIESFAAVSNQWLDSISTAGVPHASQPNFSNLAGNIAISQMAGGTGATSLTCFFGDNSWKTCGGSGGAGAGVQGSQAVQGYGDVNQNPMASGHYVYFTNAAFTTARTWTLPASATQGQGLIVIYDKQRTLTSSNTLTVCAAGTDAIDGGGAASCTQPIKTQGASIILQNDGAGKFTTITANLIGTCSASAGFYMSGIDASGVCTFVNLLGGTNSWTAPQTFSEVLGTVTEQTGTTYTLAATDCGTEVDFTNASAVTVTAPATLPAGCNISILQVGAGQVAVNGTAVTAATLHSADSFTKTAAQWAIIGLNIYKNAGGSSAIAILTGRGA